MKKYQLKKILDKIIKKKNKDIENECLSTSDFRIHWRKVMTFEYQTFRKQTLIISKTFKDSSTCIALNVFKIPMWNSQILKTLC